MLPENVPGCAVKFCHIKLGMFLVFNNFQKGVENLALSERSCTVHFYFCQWVGPLTEGHVISKFCTIDI